MTTWIAFIRGINVGGKNIVRMAALRDALADAGLQNVRTYIQSGNVVFESAARSAKRLAAEIADVVEAASGVATAVQVLSKSKLEAIVARNPYPDAQDNRVHFLFLDAAARAPDLDGLEAALAPSETYVLASDVFYLHAPDGIGRSKLAARAEKLLGVRGTGRNWRTAKKILALASP